MTCKRCEQWMARSEEQWQIRQTNLKIPDIEIHQCPHCGGTDWAYSRERIQQERQQTWWQRLWKGPEKRWKTF